MPAAPVRRLVSGGQTGVDRATLEVARARGLPCGGWCPAGRWAEDGPIDSRYPLRETSSADPSQRTAWNVRDADATLVLFRERIAGGTADTVDEARRLGRPHLAVDLDSGADGAAVREWLRAVAPDTLNVAGPRESEAPGIHAEALAFLHELLAPFAPEPMRVLITGGAGLLGRTLIRTAPPHAELHATQRRTPVLGAAGYPVDLADRDALARVFDRARPELVVHTAYSTADLERDVVLSTAAVAAECLRAGARLVHLSTDALLDGENAPYDEHAEPAPVHPYGEAKAHAESAVREMHPDAAVVRTSLITEMDPPDPRCAWVADSLRSGTPITLFVDELRCPIAADDLARQIWEIAALPAAEAAGVWNLAGPEAVSRYTLGLMIAAHQGLDPSGLTPAWSAASPAPRPRDLRLLCGRAERALRSRARPIGALLLPAGGRLAPPAHGG
jgi:dTDP-4-dehydrorhamnose reductase